MAHIVHCTCTCTLYMYMCITHPIMQLVFVIEARTFLMKERVTLPTALQYNEYHTQCFKKKYRITCSHVYDYVIQLPRATL